MKGKWSEDGGKIVDGERIAWENKEGEGYRTEKKVLGGEEAGSGEGKK